MLKNNLVELKTYGTVIEETNYSEQTLFSVPEKWLERTLENIFNNTLQEFLTEYDWDSSEIVYRLAEAEGVIMKLEAV